MQDSPRNSQKIHHAPHKAGLCKIFCLRLDEQPVEVREFPGNYSERVQLIHGALLSYDKDYSPAQCTGKDLRKMSRLHKLLNDRDH